MPDEDLAGDTRRGPLRRFLGYTAIAAALTSTLTACRNVEDTRTPTLDYTAYGKKWKYFAVEHYVRQWGFDSPHGAFGLKERIEQDVYLVTNADEKIEVAKRVVALQKDGSYRQVACCDNLRARARLYNFDDKLIVTFEQTRANTTDCLVYPPGRADDEARPAGERIRYAILFGEFDPHARLFRMRDFFPGGVSDEDYKTALGVNPTVEQTDRFFYSRRKPFLCDKAR